MVGPVVTWGLLVAWVVHDVEEWAALPGWTQRAAIQLVERYPRVPARVWLGLRTSRLEAGIAISLVGVLIAWSSWAGASTGGRSGLFQVVLIAFGLHAIAHAGQSVIFRGYTPGVVTALLVVAPFSWWAYQQAEGAGIASSGGLSWVVAIAVFPLVVIGAHLISRCVSHVIGRSS
jgi:Protein of unknown function with HXXEE motif